jgi:hypothetical protein
MDRQLSDSRREFQEYSGQARREAREAMLEGEPDPATEPEPESQLQRGSPPVQFSPIAHLMHNETTSQVYVQAVPYDEVDMEPLYPQWLLFTIDTTLCRDFTHSLAPGARILDP